MALFSAMKSVERSGVAEDVEWSGALEDKEWSGGVDGIGKSKSGAIFEIQKLETQGKCI